MNFRPSIYVSKTTTILALLSSVMLLWTVARYNLNASESPALQQVASNQAPYPIWLNESSIMAFEKEFYSYRNGNTFIKNKTNEWILGGHQNRWPSPPIVTGDGFRALADFICEPENECDGLDFPGWVMRHGLRRPPIIYVKIDVVALFAEKVLAKWIHKLQLRFVLVTHNGDIAAPPQNFEHILEDPLLIAWFAQNARVMHPKLIPIPIGCRNRYIDATNVDVLLSARRDSLRILGTRPVLSVFTIDTQPGVRQPLQALVLKRLDDGYATTYSAGNAAEWYQDIAHHSMVLSPRGNGLDTHRTWETLYMGRVPVVVTSAMDAVFEGLPVIILQNWDDLTKEKLAMEYRYILKRIRSNMYDPRRLDMSFYACQIYEKVGRRC